MKHALALTALSLAILVAAPVVAPASSRPAVRHPARVALWRPDVRSARAYIRTRRGLISFAVQTEHGFWGYESTRTYPSASVFKAMLLVAYLDHPSVRGRALHSHDTAWLVPMIERSDDTAAQHVFDFLGRDRLRALGQRVGMRRLTVARIWGRSRIDAADQARFFLHIDSFVVPRHRAFALHLLASVTPSQRWGFGRLHVHGWRLYFKGGWGAGTGWVDHQVALLLRGPMRVSVAILTHFDGSHAYGKATLEGIASRLLHGLGTRARVASVRPRRS